MRTKWWDEQNAKATRAAATPKKAAAAIDLATLSPEDIKALMSALGVSP